MEKEIDLAEFCIWGTGKYGKKLYSKIELYSSIYHKVLRIDLIYKLKYFIDNNKEKQKEKFYNKKVVAPDYYFDDTVSLCVVAALSRNEIYNILEGKGKKQNIDYISVEDFEVLLQKKLLQKRNRVLEYYGIYESLQTCDYESCIESLASILIKNQVSIIEQYVVFSYAIDFWDVSTNKEDVFLMMQKYFKNEFIVAAFAWYYGNDIEKISESFSKKSINTHKKRKPTVGIVVYNYFGGGIEKVVSLLIPMYLKEGHEVVLITDSYDPDKEYSLPVGAKRYVMEKKMDGELQFRGEELLRCIEKYKIDIVCFHSGYTYISTFYDMWVLRLCGIPVIIELHSFFLPIITEKKEVSKHYHSMYRMANCVIVLSSTDKEFWKNLGCKCICIPNPIENTLIPNENGDNLETYNIAWIGRIVQLPKRVLDIVPIMKIVSERVQNVKLSVIGLATNQRIYNELVNEISKNSLNKVIEIKQYQNDIKKIYKDIDVVLMTSESESFSNVIMESKICGIPLVMYELPWLELLKEKKGYIAVEQGNIEAIAEAVIKVLTDKYIQKKLSKEARESIISFMERDIYKEWEKVFNEVIFEDDIINYVSESMIIEKGLLRELYK